MKILFLGNSITLHSPAPDIGWHGNYGMAASCEENDYVHQLCAKLETAGKCPQTRVRNVAEFERNPDGIDAEWFADDIAFDPDIVILRISENTPVDKLDAFAAAYEKLIRLFREIRDCRIFAVGSFWPRGRAEELLCAAAEAAGADYLSLSALHGHNQYQAIGQFEHEGVAGHPSDAGMAAIADIIYNGMEHAGLLQHADIAPLPQGEPTYDRYSVTVDGMEAPLYCVHVSAHPFNRPWPGHQRDIGQSELAAMLTLDMYAPMDIVVHTQTVVKKAVVRPLSAGVKTEIVGNEIRFTIRHPGQYSLEMDGRHYNLHLFANAPEEKQSKAYTYYYPAGIHDVGNLVLRSDESVYIEAGAVVFGAIQAYDAENIRIAGRGILDYSKLERPEPFAYEKTGLMNLVRCKNVTIDGIILRDSSWWTITSVNCQNLYFHNVKSVGMWRYNSDGFDFVCCQNVHVDGCFLRNFDDVIVFKGYDLGEFGITPVSPDGKVSPAYNLQNNENCLVENCVIWCDWGGALELGAETATDEYVNLVFRNCDIIHKSGGAMRMQSGDRAYIHQLLYDDIRVEYDGYEEYPMIQETDDAEFIVRTPCISGVIEGWMYCGKWSNAGILGNVSDIIFRNISVYAEEGITCPAVCINGVDADHGFWNIQIENFTFNGEHVEVPLQANEFTDIKIK